MKLGMTFAPGVQEPLSARARAARVLFIFALLLVGIPASRIVSAPVVAHAASYVPPIQVSDCTTESALTSALTNAHSGDTIQFVCDGTIPITSTIGINKTVAITAKGHNVTLDAGGNNNRIFTVATDATSTGPIAFSVTYLKLANGNAGTGRGGAIWVPDTNSGGGLYAASVGADHDTFTSNSASEGGAIATNFGNLTVTNSTFSGNHATNGNGGAIGDDEVPGPNNAPNYYSATLTADTFDSNTATGTGGAIGLGSNSPATITSSTLAGNSAVLGGGAILTFGTATLLFNTIANNTGGGGAISDSSSPVSGNYLMRGNILDNATNCSRTDTWTDDGYNLQKAANSDCGFGPGTLTGNPFLGPLQDNGGPTKTMALGSGSQADNLGKVCQDLSNTQIATDQRGLPRPTVCDAGAFQRVAARYDDGENYSSTWGGTAGNPFAITGTGEPYGVVNLYTSQDCSGTSIAATNVSNSGAFAVAAPSVGSQGQYSYSASVTSPADGAITCAGPLTVNVDRTAPQLTVRFPALGTSTQYENASAWTNGCNTPQFTVTSSICGTVYDSSSGVAAVYVAIENAAGQFWNGGATADTSQFNSEGTWVQADLILGDGSDTWTVQVPQPPDGAYTVAAAAMDWAGNTQTIFQQSIAGICTASGTGGQLSLNGGQLSINGGLCTVNGTGANGPVSGQLSINGGQLSLNGGQLSLNGGQLSLNGGQLSINGGTCTVNDNSGNSGQLSINGGTLSSTGGQLSLNGGQLSINGGQLSLNGGQLSINGGINVNSGPVSLNGAQCSLTTSGGSGQLSLNGGQLITNGSGQLSLNGGQLSINGGQLSINGGQLSLNGGQLSINGGAGGNAGNVVVDTVPPHVSNFTIDGKSTSGIVNVNPGATFNIAFNESMNTSTVNTSTVTVTKGDGTSFAPSSFTVDATGLTASFNGFQPRTTYTVTVTNAATDLAGNQIIPSSFTFTTAAFSSLPPNSTASQDTDGDNIPNGWDGTTTPTFTSGTQTTNTAAWGFTSQHKDLCLVENYMAGNVGTTYYNQAISQAANQAIVNAFANAPVTNPDGRNGIHLVIFEGDAAHSAGLPSGYSGPYYGGQITMTSPLGDASSGAFNWGSGTPSFDNIRSQYFEPTGLAQFCHYAVIAHTLGGSFASGASRGIDASDLVIALGGTIVGAGVGTQSEQQGTVMHELGHNLGLHHGGGPGISDLDVNFKPNYMSVMNYFFQFTGVTGGFTSNGLDYSHGTNVGTPLNENSLLDSIGLGSGALLSSGAFFGTRYICGSGPRVVVNASQPIDWGCSGITSSPVSAYVNGDSSQYQTLNDYNDWAHLQFNGGDIGEGAVLPPPTSTTIDISPTASGGPDSAPDVEAYSLAKFKWSGFQAPLAPDSTTINVGKAGRTYPVSFQLQDSAGNYVSWLSAVGSITVTSTSCTTGAPTDTIDATTTGSAGLRYSTGNNQFTYNWATPPQAGCYTLNINLADGTQQQAQFQLK